MDRTLLCRLLAAKWLESAEQVEHRELRRCYARRALAYQAEAARASAWSGAQSTDAAGISPDE
jgi:hypothetical protein